MRFFFILPIFLAILTVLATNPIYIIIFLMLTFVSSSILLFLLKLDFLGLILIIVYATGISILFLFIIMTIQITFRVKKIKLNFINFILFSFFSFCIILIIWNKNIYFNTFEYSFLIINLSEYSNLVATTKLLYSNYFFCLILAAISLFVAMVGSIVLIIKFYKISYRQWPSYQQIKS